MPALGAEWPLVMAVAPGPVHHGAMGDGVVSNANPDGRSAGSSAVDPVDPSPPVWLPPAVVGTAALREPGPAVLARQQARRGAGLDADGLGYPRTQLWLLLVLPSAVIAALCLLALLVSGLVILGVAGAAAAAVAGASTGYLLSDRLRMASSERRELVANRSWHSAQPWIGELTQTPERRVVAQAQDAVTRLISAPAWSSPAFEGHRLRLDLKAELDEIDAQAYRLAASDPSVSGPSSRTRTPAEARSYEAARAALRQRVDALSAYAEAVSALAPERLPTVVDEEQDRLALTATVRDEFATDQWTALRHELPVERRRGAS